LGKFIYCVHNLIDLAIKLFHSQETYYRNPETGVTQNIFEDRTFYLFVSNSMPPGTISGEDSTAN